MNRQALADIETIHVRVEERRLGVKSAGNWRVYEFTGFDAIPATLEGAFGGNALPIQCHIRDMYQRRRAHCHLEDCYEASIAGEQAIRASVSRTLTISVRYRTPRDRLILAA